MEEKETKKVVRKPRKIQKDKMVKAKLYEEQVVEVKSVTKVNKGGRQRRFSALVVVGDRKGKVGIGMGKAAEVPDAIQKASQQATKNVTKVYIADGDTVSHEAIGKVGSTRVIVKPAKEGTGLVAGGAVRNILELAGFKNIVSKSLGARTKKNMAESTIKALKEQKSPEYIAKLRGKTKEEILG